jgi:hypothetical protein
MNDILPTESGSPGHRGAVVARLIFMIVSAAQWSGAVWFSSATLYGYGSNTWISQLASDGTVVDERLILAFDEEDTGDLSNHWRTVAIALPVDLTQGGGLLCGCAVLCCAVL